MSTRLSSGTVHKLPADLRKMIIASDVVTEAWQDITPLAGNEWICWVTSPKKPETRVKRIATANDMLKKGKRRPCCWPGCPHR